MNSFISRRLFVALFLLTGIFGTITRFVQIPHFEATCFAQGSESEEKPRVLKATARAKRIYDRSKMLTASVIAVSKGAKGVGAPISNRKVWEPIAKSQPFKNVIKEAEDLLQKPIPLPTNEDYMRFYETKAESIDNVNRDYENKYNDRRNRLFRLVLAECFENEGRFILGIEEAVMAICMEPNWTIPWEDGEAKKHTGESRVIDYHMARTAWNLATMDYWLGRKLSVDVRDLYREIIQQRIFSVFAEAVLTDQYNLIGWAESNNHQNASCHAAVVGAALALIDAADQRSQFIAAAELNVEKFLQIFSRDGYFPDGVWAWNQGYGSFILLAETLYQATDGRIDMFKRPNIRDTALYGARMEITPGVYESFGNHWRGDRPQLFPTAFISKRFNMGLTEIENRYPYFGIGPGPLFMVGIYCFPNSASEQKGMATKPVVPPVETLRSEFPLNGVLILRTGKKERNQIGVQLKGGTNDERSNHSDVGAYVVAVGGGLPLADIGARYNRRGLVIKDIMESNFVNSFGHPVPRINEQLQKNGKGTVAPLLERNFSDTVDTLKFDLSYVYEWADTKDLKEFTRTFIFDRTGEMTDTKGRAGLIVTDKLRYMKPLAFENCLITFGPFKMLTENPEETTSFDLIVGEGDQALRIKVENEVVEVDEELNKFTKRARPMVFEAGLIDEPMPRGKKQPIRLNFGFEQPVGEVTMTIKITPTVSSERNLAKNSPDETTRTYTSPIDEQIVEDFQAGTTTSEDGTVIDATAALVGKYAEQLKKVLAGDLLEKFKNASNEEIKAQLLFMKRINPDMKNMPDIKDDQLDTFIQSLKDSL